MKKILVFFVLISIIPLNLPAFLISVQKHIYPSGTKLLLYHDPSTKLVSIQAWVAVGSGDEEKGEEGLAHLLEHMMFRGAERGKGYIAKEIEKLGGDINAYTSFDHTVYHIYIDAKYWKKGLKILADRIFNADFKADEFEAEKKVVIEEIKMNMDDPTRFFHKKSLSGFYPQGHPYHHPIIGYKEKVEKYTLEDLRRFYKKHYIPSKITFIICGNVPFEEAKSYLEEFIPHKRRRSFTEKPFENTYFERKVDVFLRKDIKLAKIMLLFPIPGVYSEELPYIDLISSYLSDGKTSPLIKELREEKRLFRSIGVYSFTPKMEGALMIYGEIDPEKVYKGLDELVKLLQDPHFSVERLERTKTTFTSDLYFSLEDLRSVARYIGYFDVDGGDWKILLKYIKKVENCDLETLLCTYFKYINPKNASLFVLSPRELDRKKLLSILDKKVSRIKRITLPNGVKIIMEKRTRTPTFSIVAALRGGVIFENRENNGIFHAISRLLTRGCNGMDSMEFSRRLEEIGGRISGFSGRNTFGLRGSFLTKYQEEGLELFFKALFHPTFTEKELDKVKKDIIDDIRREKENPVAYSIRRIFQIFYGDRGYGLPVKGTEKSVGKISRDEVLKTYREFLSTKNLFITVVGLFDENSLIKQIEEYTKTIKNRRCFKYPSFKLGNIETYREKSRLRQSHIIYAFYAPTINSPNRYIFYTLRGIMGGQGGILFRELRDKRALCYAIFPFYFPGEYGGLFGIYIGTDKEKMALDGIRSLLEKLDLETIEDQIDRGKALIKGEFEMSLDTNGERAFQIALYEAMGLGYEEMDSYGEKIMMVRPDEILKKLKRYMGEKRVVFIYSR